MRISDWSSDVCSSDLSTRLQAKGKAPMKTTLLAIDGMHCDGCARTIEALLARLPGVHKVETSFEERRARVLHAPQRVSETEFAEAVAKGGRREERRGGNDRVSQWRSRWSRNHYKK